MRCIYNTISSVEKRFAFCELKTRFYGQSVVENYGQRGIKKIAYIMPTEFIEKLSIEQVYDEVATAIEQTEPETQLNYFDKETEALRWFNQKTNTLHKYA